MFVAKTNGRIFVTSNEDAEQVRSYLKSVDLFEYGYMADDFIAVVDPEQMRREYMAVAEKDDLHFPKMVYGGKFEADIRKLIDWAYSIGMCMTAYSGWDVDHPFGEHGIVGQRYSSTWKVKTVICPKETDSVTFFDADGVALESFVKV